MFDTFEYPINIEQKYLLVFENDQLQRSHLIEGERLEIGRAEGSEIHFRNLKIMELPSGITSSDQTAPLINSK